MNDHLHFLSGGDVRTSSLVIVASAILLVISMDVTTSMVRVSRLLLWISASMSRLLLISIVCPAIRAPMVELLLMAATMLLSIRLLLLVAIVALLLVVIWSVLVVGVILTHDLHFC